MFGLKDRLRSVSSGLVPGGLSPIAIDFGAAGMKALQVTGGETPNLVTAAYLPVPENLLGDPVKRMAWQLENLPELIRSTGFKGKRAVCAIPASQAYYKHLQAQAGSPREVASQVQNTLAAQLGCGPEALLCRYVDVGPGASGVGKVEVIGIATARGMVERLMAAIRACRLEPVGMQPECVALLRSFDHITRRAADAETTSLYLDMGNGYTRAVIAHGKNMAFAKSVAIGGFALDSLVAKQLKLVLQDAHAERISCSALTAAARAVAPPPPAAEAAPGADHKGDGMALLRAAMKQQSGPAKLVPLPSESATAVAEDDRRVGSPPPGAIPVESGPARFTGPRIDLQEPLDALTDEITMCLRYHDSIFPGRKLTRTIFVGGESRHVALCKHVARVLRAPASVADPMARLARTGNERCAGVSFDKPQPGWAVAVGLCMGPTDL